MFNSLRGVSGNKSLRLMNASNCLNTDRCSPQNPFKLNNSRLGDKIKDAISDNETMSCASCVNQIPAQQTHVAQW